MIPTTGIRERPRDPELGVPVPFVCEFDDGSASVTLLNKHRVTQCALSRICAVCGDSLGRPLAFLGPRLELDRMAFHVPAVHIECGRAMVEACAPLGVGVLGQAEAVPEWVLVTAPAFAHERPQVHDDDRRPTFRPSEILATESFPAH